MVAEVAAAATELEQTLHVPNQLEQSLVGRNPCGSVGFHYLAGEHAGCTCLVRTWASNCSQNLLSCARPLSGGKSITGATEAM